MNRAVRSFAVAAAALLALAAAASVAAHTTAGTLRSARRATVPPPSADPIAPGGLCRAQRDAMGAAAFNQLWVASPAAARAAMGRCVTSMAKAGTQGQASQVQRSIMTALQTCKSMRRADAAAFRKRFGTNTSASNALGKCVRSRTKLRARRVAR